MGRPYDFDGVDAAMDLINLNDASIDRVLREQHHGRNITGNLSKTIEEKRQPALESTGAGVTGNQVTSDALNTIVSGATKVLSQNKMNSFFDESQIGGSQIEVEVPSSE